VDVGGTTGERTDGTVKATVPRPSGRKRAVQLVKRDFGPTWRLGFNLGPTVRHVRHPRPLGAEAQRVLRALRREGVAITTAAQLLGDPTLFDEASARVEELIVERAGEIDAIRGTDPAGPDRVASPEKRFLVELMGAEPVIHPDDPLVRLALDDQIRGVAEAYTRMQLQLRDLNAWINVPTMGEAFSSQRWHRDLPEDHSIVKAFIFMRDIDEGAGPTEFASGSHRGRGRRVKVPAEFDGLADRADDAAMDEAFPPATRAKGIGPAGTIMFVDTRGYHRGGRATTSDRVVLQALYSSRSSIRHSVLHRDPTVDPAQLADVVTLPPLEPSPTSAPAGPS
jgi:hypothetical protein